MANMAQMWADKCIWEHGFLRFGSQYPYSVPFKGQIGKFISYNYVPFEEELLVNTPRTICNKSSSTPVYVQV